MTNPSENPAPANETLLREPHLFYYTLGLLHGTLGKNFDDRTIVQDSLKIFVMVTSKGGIKKVEKDGTLLKEVCDNLSKHNVQFEPQRLLKVYYDNLLDKYESILYHKIADKTMDSSPLELDPHSWTLGTALSTPQQTLPPVPLLHSVPNAGWYDTTTATSTSPIMVYSKSSSSPPQWVYNTQSLFSDYKGSLSIKDVKSGATVPKTSSSHGTALSTLQAPPPGPLHSVPSAGYYTTTATSTSPKVIDSKTSSSPPQWFNELQSPFYDYKGRFSSIKDVRSGATVPKTSSSHGTALSTLQAPPPPVPLHSVPNAWYNTTAATSTFPKVVYSKPSSSPPQRVYDTQSLISDCKGSSSINDDVILGATVPKQNLELSIGDDRAAERKVNEQKEPVDTNLDGNDEIGKFEEKSKRTRR